MSNSKIIRSAKIIDRIMRVLQGFMIAFVVLSGIFIVLAYTVGEKIIQDASRMELGNLALTLSADALPAYPALRKSIVFDLVAVIVMAAAGWILLRVIRQILKPMKAGKPFESGIASKVRQLGWTTLIGGAIIEACHVFGVAAELKAYDMNSLVNQAAVQEVSFNLSFDLTFAVIAGILFFLSLVFRYGENLQQEADETL